MYQAVGLWGTEVSNINRVPTPNLLHLKLGFQPDDSNKIKIFLYPRTQINITLTKIGRKEEREDRRERENLSLGSSVSRV